jgi:hypothetical protein
MVQGGSFLLCNRPEGVFYLHNRVPQESFVHLPNMSLYNAMIPETCEFVWMMTSRDTLRNNKNGHNIYGHNIYVTPESQVLKDT